MYLILHSNSLMRTLFLFIYKFRKYIKLYLFFYFLIEIMIYLITLLDHEIIGLHDSYKKIR